MNDLFKLKLAHLLVKHSGVCRLWLENWYHSAENKKYKEETHG